jgi:hypothetical protein
MRRVAWGLLLLFAFAVPWEYSLDLGEPLGNIARVLGLVLLLFAVPAVLQSGRMRTPGAIQWVVLALFLWFCCSYFWTIGSAATLEKMRAYFQEMMIVWLVWEFVDRPEDLRALLQAFVGGSWVLALLTLANFRSTEAMASGQIRFVAEGQDPNDVARFLDLGFPLAALLLSSVYGKRRWPAQLLAMGYLPLGLVAVLLTASRGGFLAAMVALGGCALLLAKSHPKFLAGGLLAMPVIAAGLWIVIPQETFDRLATIPSQMEGGDFNQRLNIWDEGWHAFARAPMMGSGAGTFTLAAGTNRLDTAHNSELSIVVAGGLCALALAAGIVTLAVRSAARTRGPMRLALVTVLLMWFLASLVDTVEENRATWLLLGLIAVAGRLAVEEPERMDACFPVRAIADEPEIRLASGAAH